MPQEEHEQQHLNGMPANPNQKSHKGKRLIISSIIYCTYLPSYIFGSVSH